MLRLLSVVLVVIVPLLSGVASAASPEKVVFINPGIRGEVFWENVARSMQVAANQLGFVLDVRWAERNKFKMQALGIAAAEAEEKPSFIILVNEERAASPILAATEKAGIKTVFLSSPMSDHDVAAFEAQHGAIKYLLGSIVPDMSDAGARMGRALVEEASRLKLHASDGKLHLVGLAGDDISPTSLMRNQGFYDFLKQREDVAFERMLFANWNEKEAEQLTTRFLELMKRKGQPLAGVWAANDPMALGAIKALKKSGVAPGKDTVVVGLNWSADAIKAIQQDDMLLSDGGHFLAGAWVMIILADYMNGCGFTDGIKNQEIKFSTSAIDRKTDDALLNLIIDDDYDSIDFTQFLTHHKTCLDYKFTPENLVNALKD
jgi:ABC-type sugar transport system substrate-binding protein